MSGLFVRFGDLSCYVTYLDMLWILTQVMVLYIVKDVNIPCIELTKIIKNII